MSTVRFAFEHDLTEVLVDKAEQFERAIAEKLGEDFLREVSNRKFTELLTAEEFNAFDAILADVLEIPSAKEALSGQTLDTRRAYLPGIAYALKQLYPEATKLINRYILEAKSKPNEPFDYGDYAEGLINMKKRGNPRLYQKFYDKLRAEVEKARGLQQDDDIIQETPEGEFNPVDFSRDVRDIVNKGANYYIERPDLQQRWIDYANRHIERSFNQGHSATQIKRSLEQLLNVFKRDLPNEVVERTRADLIRRLRKLAGRTYEVGDIVKHGRFNGIVFSLDRKRQGRQVYNVLLVGAPHRGGWLIPVFAEALKPSNYELTEDDKAVIDDWRQWENSREAAAPNPIRRNHDYGGNYLDRIRNRLKKRKRAFLVKRLRVTAGFLRKKAVKEYFDEEEILELLSDGLPDLKVEKMPGEKRDFAGMEEKELPFAYGEIPNYINPVDDMGWDVILLPSTLGSTKDELAPVGILRYNRDVDYWDTFPGDDPIGNDKILLGKKEEYLGVERGIYTHDDAEVLDEFFGNTEAFEQANFFWDYV